MNDKWKKKLKKDPIPWLLESNLWTKYKTFTDLLGISSSAKEVKKIEHELNKNQLINCLIKETLKSINNVLTRHNDPKIWFYKLRMLIDFGLTIKNAGIREIISQVIIHLEDGMYAAKEILPEKGKGFVKPDNNVNEWHSLPCDSPIIIYSLLCSEYKSKQLLKAIDKLKDKWSTPAGWFCHFFFVEGQFKKFQIGCPMAGLMALEVFSLIPELKESQYAKNAYEPLKFHKELGKSIYFFGRSKKFWTLKYPFVWYNALYLAEVLTRFDFLKKEKLVKELVNWIEQSQDENGRFRPTSIFLPYKNWDFGNKKEPSPWITFLCCRILKRWYG